MAIILPRGMPAADRLRREGVPVLDPGTYAGRPPLRVLLVNLMPDKARAETQFACVLGAGPRPVELTLTVPSNHVWRHTASAHLERFYLPWRVARPQRFDGLIVTGAPVETLDFEAVDYWADIRDIIDWAAHRRIPSLYICWAAQAALYQRFGVPKHALPRKAFGVYRQHVLRASALLRGIGEHFATPVSRHTGTRALDLPTGAGLALVAASPQTGPCLVEDRANRVAYLFNHPEYDATALADEFRRDLAAGLPIVSPANYFPDDDPARRPPAYWAPQARRFYANWLDVAAGDRSPIGIPALSVASFGAIPAARWTAHGEGC